MKRRGGLVVAPLLPTSPLKPKASKAFKEDLENQDANQLTPSHLPRQTKTWNAMKEMIKSSVEKKISEFCHELKRIAVGSKTPVGEEAKKEVNNAAESPQQDSKLLIPK
ncbi:hypothetical protein ZIOFF_006010 [Zingiber officinale]|uniref:Uncharacterized protein n=1 Tax=Zingiber officinale TaxID=94328 RepID=A0A8J5HV08_ZINOF|nr:hypothetical protein ZIOFF_006010 [Zingiber officinale]